MARKVHIGARIEPDLYSAITQEAIKKGVTLSEEVSRLLNNGLSNNDYARPSSLHFLYGYFPTSWVQELFFSISEEYEEWSGEPSVQEFCSELADRTEALVEEGVDTEDRLRTMPRLPKDLEEALEELLYDLTKEADDLTDRKSFFLQWANLLREASGDANEEAEDEEGAHELILQFEAEDMAQIRKFLVRKGLDADEELYTALSQYMYKLLGKALVREAGPLLLAWNGEEEMAKVGERLQKAGFWKPDVGL
ncbi:MAG: hypothetical protein ACE362_08370 [Phaeodactylibacter xiamenensis]|uniref:Uncharacterized protein n=1 Tax=Phaeodactylibacter xiamenensis TaxID=1524460 RepID=A0A098SAB9_9BACT|nr:hypothetical protein [Phaeodactylibacter xiamenensis]KGE88588.1 hypothetical protein IX84_07880 [Phaeodactylibacter xiamenensis]